MTHLDILKSFYVHLKTGEKQQAFDLIADDATWHSDEIGAPWSGIYHGKTAILTHFEAMSASIEQASKTTEEHIEKGDLVIELSTLRCLLKKTGALFETQLVCLYRFKNQKICSYRVFEDSLKLYRAYFPEHSLPK